MKKTWSNNSGFSLIQSLMMIALVSGMSVGVMNLSQQQKINAKRIETSADVMKAMDVVYYGFSNVTSCTNALAGITLANVPMNLNPDTNPQNGLDINAVGLTARSGQVLSNNQFSFSQNLYIDNIKIGGATNIVPGSIKSAEIYVTFRKVSTLLNIDSPGFDPANPQTVTKMITKTLPEPIVLMTSPTALPAGSIDGCFANTDIITQGVRATCASIGGEIVGNFPDFRCDLITQADPGNAFGGAVLFTLPITASQIGVSAQYIEDSIANDLLIRADDLFINTQGPETSNASITASNLIVGAPLTDNDAVNYQWLEAAIRGENNDFYQIPDGQVGLLTGGSGVKSGILNCPAGEYFSGLKEGTATTPDGGGTMQISAVCKPLLGNMISCPVGTTASLEIQPGGGVQFKCGPPPAPPACVPAVACPILVGQSCPSVTGIQDSCAVPCGAGTSIDASCSGLPAGNCVAMQISAGARANEWVASAQPVPTGHTINLEVERSLLSNAPDQTDCRYEVYIDNNQNGAGRRDILFTSIGSVTLTLDDGSDAPATGCDVRLTATNITDPACPPAVQDVHVDKDTFVMSGNCGGPTGLGVCTTNGEISCGGGCYPLVNCTSITGSPAVDVITPDLVLPAPTNSSNGCNNGTTFQEVAEGANEPWRWNCVDGGGAISACHSPRMMKVLFNITPFNWTADHIYTPALVDITSPTVHRGACTPAYKDQEAYLVDKPSNSPHVDPLKGQEWYVSKCDGAKWVKARNTTCNAYWCGDVSDPNDEITAIEAHMYYTD